MTTTLRRVGAAAAVATLLFAPTACSDEDGDGAKSDEEVDQVDEQMEDTGDQIEEEIDEGDKEVDE
jgi:gas vesicle protein